LPTQLSMSCRNLVSLRSLLILLIVVLLGVGVSSASARKSSSRAHLRLRAMAHAFVNVALPGEGLLPDEADETDDLPDDGKKYELKLAHAHTDEVIDVVYRIGDTYIPEAIDKLSAFLRDTHNQEVSRFDPRTFDVLHTVLLKLGKPDETVDILSGYRSQETNDELRESGTTNAAKYSQHIQGRAMDIRVPGVSAARVRDAALSLDAGGVGYYPQSQFVHVDVGPVRQWTYAHHAGRRHAHRSRRA
jgi:uncharacterized protein YcbK (DUF882 family)